MIDIAGVYDIDMTFKLYLYKPNDECEELTGGYVYCGLNEGSFLYSNVSVSKSTDNIKITVLGSSSTLKRGICDLLSNNKIDTSGYTKIKFDLTIEGSTGTGCQIGLTGTKATGSIDSTTANAIQNALVKSTTPISGVNEVDIASLTTPGYVWIRVQSSNDYNPNNITVYVNSIWLE